MVYWHRLFIVSIQTMSYYRLPFHLQPQITGYSEIPFGSDVYVIPDSEYKKYKQEEAKKEIAILESRAESYEKTAASLRQTVKELREENNLQLNSSDNSTD